MINLADLGKREANLIRAIPGSKFPSSTGHCRLADQVTRLLSWSHEHEKILRCSKPRL